ncbi:MAG: hypothetical protein AAFU67_10675 [Bacteroidota bacterium]
MINGTLSLDFSQANWLRWARGRLFPKMYQIKLPEKWSELSAESVEPVFNILAHRESFQVPTLDLFNAIVDVPPRLISQLGPQKVAEELLPHLDWMLNAPCTVRLIDHVETDGGGVASIPNVGFRGMSMHRYRTADEAYMDLQQELTDEALDRFIRAFLGLSKNEKVENLQRGISYFILHYYTSNKQELFNKYFPQEIDSHKEDKSIEEMDWESLFIAVAERGVFGPLHRVKEATVHSFFTWIGKNHRQIIEQKKKTLQDLLRKQNQKFLA